MTISRIVTLTLNPAVDHSGNVNGLIPSEKLRCTGERIDPGGGGINVARVLTRFGADTVAIFPVGGLTGSQLLKLVEAEAIRFHTIPVSGATRENFSIHDTASGHQYRFVFPGAPLPAWYAEQCCNEVMRHIRPGGYLIASGSLPPATDPGIYGALAGSAYARGTKVVLDCGGQALRQALGTQLELVKVNRAELEDVTGKPVRDGQQCLAAARTLLASGTRMVAVTRGDAGAMLVSQDEAWEAAAPNVQCVSTVGAGDSFLAALVFSLAQHKSMGEALRMAVAAGSAALLTEGTGLCWMPDIENLVGQVQLRPMENSLQAVGG